MFYLKFKKLSIFLAIACLTTAINTGVVVKADDVPAQTTVTEQTTTVAPSAVEETTTGNEEPLNEPDVPEEEKYQLIAHRGFSGYAPENSMPAFESAVDAGFKYIEFDIQRTKPDENGKAEWVVSHDDTLTRLFGVDKKISDLTLDEIKKYNYIDGNNINNYPNLKIVSLTELIAYMKKVKEEGINVIWRLELKTLENTEEKKYYEDEVVKPLKEAGVFGNVKFISFHYSYLKAIKEIDDRAVIGFLAKVLDEDYIEYARKCYADEISIRGDVFQTEPEYIEQARNEGFKMGVYNVDSQVVMGGYYKLGVQLYTTNSFHPRAFTEEMLQKEYSIKDFDITLSKTAYTFSNTRKKPTVTVKFRNIELVSGLNYEVSYSNNKNPGKAVCTVSGINNVKEEKDFKYTIKMPKVKGLSLSKNAADSIRINWTANTSVTGYKIYQYNYVTKKYVLIKTLNKGTYNSYKVTKLPYATKVRFRLKTFFTENNKTYTSSACTGKTSYTKPKQGTIKSLKRTKKGKKLTIKYKSVARATGYNVKVSTSKTFSSNVKTLTKTKKTTKFSMSLLHKKKTYYVKVRAYLKVGKTYYYGKYSTVKKIKGYKKKSKKKK